MKLKTLLFIAITLAIAARLTPFIITATPFSTDSWPLIGLSEKLVRMPTRHIFDDKYYDGYNNHWPAVIMYSSVASLVIGLKPIELMPVLIPLVNAFTILFLVLIIKEAIGFREAVLSAITISVIPPLIVFTSAATKEGFAHPLFMALIYLSMVSQARMHRCTIIVFLLLGSVLVLAHHLTTFMFIYLFVLTLVLSFLNRIKFGLDMRISIYPLVIVVFSAILHHLFIGPGVFRVTASAEDVLSLVLYTVLFSIPVVLMTSPGARYSKYSLKAVASTLVLLLIVVYGSKYSLAPGVPPLGYSVLYYAIPYVFAPMAIWSTYRYMVYRRSSITSLMTAWVMGAFSLIIYLLLSNNPLGASAVHRVLDFLAFPLGSSIGVVVADLIREGNSLKTRVLGLTVIGATVFSGLSVVSSLVLGYDTVSFYWVYNKAEYYSGSFVKSYVGNVSIAGDVKISYLYMYFSLPVDSTSLIRLVVRGELGEDTLYIVYSDNYAKGVVQALMVFRISSLCISMLKTTNKAYDSYLVNMYIG